METKRGGKQKCVEQELELSESMGGTQVDIEAVSPPCEGPLSFTKHLGTPCLLCLAVVGFLAFLQQ